MAELRPIGKLNKPPYIQECSHECPNCGSHKSHEHLGPIVNGEQQDFAAHKYSKITCADCGRYIKWGVDPKKPLKKRRSSGQKDLLESFSNGFCELCLRTETLIPRQQQLEAHHIIPVEMGGGNDKANIQIVCTQCHKLIHHIRTYLGHYGKASVSELNLEQQEDAA
jgi:5-methylcytosine-specific restriction endonuclease McrA